jgi:O-antigen/teichoic acid export membrane protein
LIFVKILYVAIPIFLFKQSEKLLHAFLKGYEQFGKVMVISSISKTLFLSVQIVIAILTQSIVDVFYGALTVSVLLFFVQAVYIKCIHKDRISFNKASIKTAKSLLHFGSWNWLSSIVQMLKSQGDKWIVSGLLGLKTFGFYSVGVLVFNQLHTVLTSSVLWVFPQISNGGLDNKLLVKNYWRLLLTVVALGFVISFSLSSLDILFELWLGKEFYLGSRHYLDAFFLLFPVFTMTIVPYLYLLGLGLVRGKFFADIFSLVVKIITIWVVISIFNIKEWVLFFVVFIGVEYISYSLIISRSLPIKFLYLAIFFVFQVVIFLIRVEI